MGILKRFISNFYVLATVSFLCGLISVYDNVMNVIFFESLPRDEQNPVASWIISESGVNGLIEIKSLGTVCAVAIMLVLAKTRYRLAIWGVFIFQIALFCYLTFYAPSGIFVGKDLFLPLKLFLDFYMGN